jgi:nitrate reductase gamma subunit
MNGFLFTVTYLAILVFIIACMIRGFQYARMPLHLRWELYPAPHGFMDELAFMCIEIFFLKSLWESNRKLWFCSFPFHLGLYLLIATLVLLALDVFTGINFQPAFKITGPLGLGLGIIGACGLLTLRLSDPSLKIYTTHGDIFNLVFFIVTFGVWAAVFFSQGVAPKVLALARAIHTWDADFRINSLTAIGLLLNALLIAYIPMTHMAHFIAKYFTYHSIRWDDAPNLRDGNMEKRLRANLAYRPTWAAAHIKADGERTWAEIAMSDPAHEVKK